MRWKKGSLTVEASFVMPCAILLVALLVVLCFYVHDRCWYRCAAYEAALVGNRPARGGAEEAEANAAQAAAQRIADQVMPGSVPAASVARSGRGTEVRFSGKRYGAFQTLLPMLSESAEITRVRPEKIVRLSWLRKRRT